MFRPEILAPAGNLFKLETAVRYGADAVYIAGQEFGLRSGAENFTLAEIEAGCRFAHLHGARVYIVLNGFLFDQELERLPGFLKDLQHTGIDAAIVSDLGVVNCVAHHSDIPIHLSTQASTLNSQAARFWQACGVKRIVLGRETTIEEAATIKRETGVEVELFTHGAMCMAFSGNCTISNYTAGRDSNRGGCIQSCRFRYQTDEGQSGFFLSSKDLEGVSLMPQFINHQIDSLKIEGRMKSALYVATTVRAYVAARDQIIRGITPDFARLGQELNSMSHRDYTTGSLAQKAGSDSIYNYRDGHTAHTHDLVGHVVESRDNQHVALLLKNPVKAGEVLELLRPNGETLLLKTDQMRNLQGEYIATANPNRVVLLPWVPGAERDLLLRKPKYVTTDPHPTGLAS